MALWGIGRSPLPFTFAEGRSLLPKNIALTLWKSEAGYVQCYDYWYANQANISYDAKSAKKLKQSLGKSFVVTSKVSSGNLVCIADQQIKFSARLLYYGKPKRTQYCLMIPSE